MTLAIIISTLAILTGIGTIDIFVMHNNRMVIDRLLEIKLQLDKQEVKLNSILFRLRKLQSDIEVIDNNLHTIIENINNLKEKQQ